jgi:hypothetical protein
MQQWSNSDAFDLSKFMSFSRLWDVIDHFLSFCKVLECYFESAGDTRPFDKNSDVTVMRQWWNSDATVMPPNWALLCHFQAFETPWGCDKWHKTFWQKQWSNSDETVIEQLCDSDGTGIPLIRAF